MPSPTHRPSPADGGTAVTTAPATRASAKTYSRTEPAPALKIVPFTKLDWTVDPDALVSHATEIAARALDRLQGQGIDDFGMAPLFRANDRPIADLRTLPPDRLSLLLKNSISPVPLHKTLLGVTSRNGKNRTLRSIERR